MLRASASPSSWRGPGCCTCACRCGRPGAGSDSCLPARAGWWRRCRDSRRRRPDRPWAGAPPAVDDVSAAMRPICAISRLASSISRRRTLPQAVALEAEVFQAEAGHAGGHHLRRPGLEVLHAADLHARIVDVDPVVVEQLCLAHDQHDGEEVAIAQRAACSSEIGTGVMPLHQFAHRRRADDVARGKALALALRGRRPRCSRAWRRRRIRATTSSRPISRSPPCALILRAAASHIMPGPLRG